MSLSLSGIWDIGYVECVSPWDMGYGICRVSLSGIWDMGYGGSLSLSLSLSGIWDMGYVECLPLGYGIWRALSLSLSLWEM